MRNLSIALLLITFLLAGCGWRPNKPTEFSGMPSNAQSPFEACYKNAYAKATNADRFEYASDHKRSKSAYQESIETLSTCLDLANSPKEKATARLLLAYSRLGLVDRLFDEKSGESNLGDIGLDIGSQLRSTHWDLTYACSHLNALPSTKQTAITNLTDLIMRWQSSEELLDLDINAALNQLLPSSPPSPSGACHDLARQ